MPKRNERRRKKKTHRKGVRKCQAQTIDEILSEKDTLSEEEGERGRGSVIERGETERGETDTEAVGQTMDSSQMTGARGSN